MAAQHGDGSTAVRRWQHNTAMAAQQEVMAAQKEVMAMQVTELQAVVYSEDC